MSAEIKKYDRVKIVDPGKLYSTYRTMASMMKLKNFEHFYNDGVHFGATGTVIAVNYHESSNKKLYGVKLDSVGRRDIVIGYDGVSLYCKNVLSMNDDLFRI